MGTTFKEMIRTPLLTSFLAAAALLFSSPSYANPENDRVYQLDSLGWLKPVDNVDGVFNEFLDEQFSKYFSGQGRFVVRPLKGLKDVFEKSSAKYEELIRDPEILRKISQKFKVEEVLRSKVVKEGDTYRFVFEVVFAPKGDVISEVEFRYIDQRREEGIQDEALKTAIRKNLDELLHKLPFLGQVTGVDGDTLTLSLGHDVGIKPRQFVTIYTLQAVKRHPILKTIEEWRWQPVGRAQIEQVDASMSFAKVTETEPGMSVLRNQKIREILSAPEEARKAEKKEEAFQPKSGWLAGNLVAGTYSREAGVPTASDKGKGGGGFQATFEVDSQVWLNSRYIVQGTLSGSILGYTPTALNTGTKQATGYSGNRTMGRFALGYSLLPMKTLYDPVAWVHAGYHFDTISMTTVLADYVATSSLSSVFVGVGGNFPVYGNLMGEIGMDLGLFCSGSVDAITAFGTANSASDLTVRLGGSWRMSERFFFRTLLSLHSEGFGFSGNRTLTQKVFSILPSVMYYF